jgi:DNA-binding NarL/FixJ family response regulator
VNRPPSAALGSSLSTTLKPGQNAAHIGKARVLIVDDQPIVRGRLAQLVNNEPDLIFCGEADDARMAITLAIANKPDVIVTGLSLKDSHGLEFINDLHVHYPGAHS